MCNAILDLSTWDGPRNKGYISVWLSKGGEETLLANLSQDVSQAQFEVVIETNEKAYFRVRSSFGNSDVAVYINGYHESE